MALRQQSRRRWVRRVGKQKSVSAMSRCVIDALEPRRLFESVTTTIPPVLANTAVPTDNSVSLDQYFTDSNVPGTLVTFSTSLGTVQVALTDAATPLTVANFLSYVNSGEYSGTFFHRSVDLNNGGVAASPSDPASIVQGGGYSIMNGSIGHIATNAPVNDEYTTETLKDTAGTLAMAKTSEANSATSEFYFNTADNTGLDTPTTDSNGNQTSYTVFGEVVSQQSYNVLEEIAALPTYNLDANAGLTSVPVTGLTEAQAQAGAPITGNNLVFIDNVTAQPGTTYTVTSADPALVTPTVTNGVVTFTYGKNLSGTTQITVVAKNLDGTSATTSFSVTVPNAAAPSSGPVATAVTAPFVVSGETESVNVLANDTDSIAALDPTQVAVVTQPTHGTASVNTADGSITYTADSGYLGPDTLTYTVADTNGTVSAPATVTLDVVPPPVVITTSSLRYTQPDGVSATITIRNGVGVFTFADYRVTSSVVGHTTVASGLGANITNITIDNKPRHYSTLVAASSGPITFGSINNSGGVQSFIAPTATLTGECKFEQVGVLRVAAALNATLDLGSGFYTSLGIPNVTNTSVTGTHIESIASGQWADTDGGTYNISTSTLFEIDVPGVFADNLALTGTGYNIIDAKVGTPTGTWGLSGSIFRAELGTPGANWDLQSNGLIRTLEIKGNLANNITAAAITTMTVSGTTKNSTIETDAGFSPRFQQIGRLVLGGAVSDTVVFSAGNIGSVTAHSLANTFIYAGVSNSQVSTGTIVSSASQLTNDARIGSVTVAIAPNAFSGALITADIIGSLNLGQVPTNADGSAEGISAHTIGSVTATLVPGGVIRASRAQLKNAAAFAAYVKLKKLTLSNFQIDLF